VQIKILKILTLLGVGEIHMNENMYNVLLEVLKRSDLASSIGNAIMYECICIITTIHASPRLLEMAIEITSYILKVVPSQLSCRGKLFLCN
jgi:AP-4 complex subunit epsilon-1